MIDSIPSLVAFLRRFHRLWLKDFMFDPATDLLRPLPGDAVIDPADIPADLSEGLATIYRELGPLVEMRLMPGGGRRRPFGTQDALVRLSLLKRIGGMIEFAFAHQGNWSCRCRTGELDPAVYSNFDGRWTESQKGFVVVCESLNHFLITFCLREAVFSCRNLGLIGADGLPETLVGGKLEPIWLRGQYVYPKTLNDFFASRDQTVIVMDEGRLWVGSPVRPLSEILVQGVKVQILQGT